MRLSAVLSGVHPLDADPIDARNADVRVVAAVRGRLDGITVEHSWPAARWQLNAVSNVAYLSSQAHPLRASLRGLPLGVLNPVELAEQLATLDHAWEGRFDASVVIGSVRELVSHGIDPAHARARFEQALDIIRAMWSLPALSGTGPEFVFDEVQPTLRPSQPGGPPLSFEAADAEGAAAAAQHRLGLHVGLEAARRWPELVATYRDGGGAGTASVCLALADATPSVLKDLATAGVDQADVVVRDADTSRDDLLRVLDELARARRAVQEV
jgi:alkanesulfonate monooxygenase SsuD/methylene tetrahydromethanopterin reductase-like flavin-dependent oxidoreductase (luciferase family)